MKHLAILMTLFASFLLNPVVAEEKPNIVYLLADDLGYGDIGSYGQKLIATPRMDRMAEHGMRFTDHYAGGPACHPLRCVLFTGKLLVIALFEATAEYRCVPRNNQFLQKGLNS